jgi:6-phosphogluconolactonase
MIRVYVDTEALAGAAADLVVAHGREAIARRGAFLLALSGGETPRRTYQALAAPPRREALDWRRVHVFWSDERCVPVDDPRRNEHLARRELLTHVPVPPAQIHAAPGPADGPEAAAETYARTLEAVVRDLGGDGLDLVLLGLGADGHMASLFPDDPALDAARPVAAVSAQRSGDVPRVTLTPVALAATRRLVVLVTGTGKAEALHLVRRGPRLSAELPAQRIDRPGGDRAVWLVDREAAEGVTGRVGLRDEERA